MFGQKYWAGVLGLMLLLGGITMAADAANPRIQFTTSSGSITLELDATNAPVTTANFLQYVDDKFFDGLIFHRVIPDFMIQGGGFDRDFQQLQTREPIENEADNGLKNLRGTIAMARTSDPHSATAQFFINLKDNDFLDHRGKNPQGWGYAVFGKVTEGMEVVDAIATVETGSYGPHNDVPTTPIVILKAERLE